MSAAAAGSRPGAKLAAIARFVEQAGDEPDDRLRVALADQRGEARRMGEDLEQRGDVELG